VTTPANPPAADAAPTTDAMIGAMFRALAALAPGAVKGAPENREAETLTILAHHGAAEHDLAVIRSWLAAHPAPQRT
jgi:hypothetical protein